MGYSKPRNSGGANSITLLKKVAVALACFLLFAVAPLAFAANWSLGPNWNGGINWFAVPTSSPSPTPTPTPSPTPSPSPSPTPTPTPTTPPVNPTGNYTYTLTGPYYEDGGVANGDISVAVLWVNGTTLRFIMHGNGITANITTFISEGPAYEILWNASSALNYTRVIDFTATDTAWAHSVSGASFNLYIPSPLVPSFYYQFVIADFAGMTNPFLKTSISTNGTNQNEVECRSLTGSNIVSFVMAQYGTYTLTFLCDQGSYSQTFLAENSFSTNLPVLAGAFLTSVSGLTTFAAQRLNETAIGIAYSNPSNQTNWLYFNITHRQGATTIFDYSYNSTGFSQTVEWNSGDSDKDYTVFAVAQVSGQQLIWIVPVPQLAGANPFSGVFDWLGKYEATLPHYQTGWPTGMTSAQIAQLVASFVIMLFLGFGSFRTAGAGCIIAVIIAGLMIAIGWFVTGIGTGIASSVPMWSLAMFFAVLTHFDESKQVVRDA